LQKDAIANYKFSRKVTGDIVRLLTAWAVLETMGQVGRGLAWFIVYKSTQNVVPETA